MNNRSATHKIGIVGTGFIAKGLVLALRHHSQLQVCAVLTRRTIGSVKGLAVDRSVMTNAVDKLIASSDLVVECTGDAVYGTVVVERVLREGLPVVTMNPELQITTGTMLSRLGTLIEAEGDQPGTLAALDQEVRNMGFRPLVYGNIKGFLNHNPSPEDMAFWSKKQKISLDKVTAFTDGSKVQIEQALVANGLGATIVGQGLSGFECKSYEDGAKRLAEIAEETGAPISDFVVAKGAPAGVFIVATHDKEQAAYLEYLKLGSGPHYVIIKPFHLCHLEISKTILKVLSGDASYRFSNGQAPKVQVVAVAKKYLGVGEVVDQGLGGFKVRGEAVTLADNPTAVPVTLMKGARMIGNVEEGKVVTFEDVDLPQTRALELWLELVEETVNPSHEDSVLNQKLRVGSFAKKPTFWLRSLTSSLTDRKQGRQEEK